MSFPLEAVRALLGLADRPCVLRMHVDAVRAAVKLRGTEADKLSEAPVEVDPSSSFVAAWLSVDIAAQKAAASCRKSSRRRSSC